MNNQFSSSQLRAARGLLNLSRPELAAKTNVSEQTIHRLENNIGEPEVRTQNKIGKVLEGAGIEFLSSDGVRRRPEGVDVLNGMEGLSQFLDGVYEHLIERGGKVKVTGVLDEQWTKYGGEHILKVHVPRMVKLCTERKDVEVLSLCPEGSTKFDYDSYTKYRSQPKELFDSVPFYVYADKLAIILFSSNPAPKIFIIQSIEIANAYRHQFEGMWQNAKKILKNKAI